MASHLSGKGSSRRVRTGLSPCSQCDLGCRGGRSADGLLGCCTRLALPSTPDTPLRMVPIACEAAVLERLPHICGNRQPFGSCLVSAFWCLKHCGN